MLLVGWRTTTPSLCSWLLLFQSFDRKPLRRLVMDFCIYFFFGFLFNAKILLRRERTGSAASGELGTAALDVALSSAKSKALPRHLRLLAPPPSALLFHTLDENSSSLLRGSVPVANTNYIVAYLSSMLMH